MELGDTSKLWSLALEYTEKLDRNRELILNLRKQAEDMKVTAKEIGSSYKVRRYNIDLSKESFDSDLERANAALVIENHALVYENRQLDALLKEYEQSIQTVMAKVRHHSQITSQHESALKKHYDSLLTAQESQHTVIDGASSDENFHHSLTRLKHLIILALHSEDQPAPEDDDNASISPLGSTSLEEALIKLGINPEQLDVPDEPTSDPAPAGDPQTQPIPRHEWSHERELEIERLQEENVLIREALGIAPGGVGYTDNETAEFGQGRSIFGEENAGTLKRMMHAKRNSIVSSPGNRVNQGVVPIQGFREMSPPEQLLAQPPQQPPPSPNQAINGIKPLPQRGDTIRKPPPPRALTSIRPSSPLGLYRNISLPSTGVSNETARK